MSDISLTQLESVLSLKYKRRSDYMVIELAPNRVVFVAQRGWYLEVGARSPVACYSIEDSLDEVLRRKVKLWNNPN